MKRAKKSSSNSIGFFSKEINPTGMSVGNFVSNFKNIGKEISEYHATRGRSRRR